MVSEGLISSQEQTQKKQLLNEQQPSVITLTEGKKESIDNAKMSAETAFKDTTLKANVGRTLGGIFGFLVLLGSVTNVIEDFKKNKRNPWVYSRIILDFVASGALIGYALKNTLLGLELGVTAGGIILIMELIYIKKG